MILKKYKPQVVGITGSVGKTSAKEAIYTVLQKKFNARTNTKNYNNEIGLPLTIIGEDSPGRNIFGWIKVFLKATKLILIKDKNYPEILVLEMGVDRPGDMKYLTSIAKCNIGVVTMIGPVHLEFFGTIEKIQKEKGELIKNLKKSGQAILNYDNKETKKITDMSKVRVLTYGFHEKALVRAQEVIFNFDKNTAGVNFKLTHDGSFVPVQLSRVVGHNAVYAALAGAAVGIALKMNLVEIAEALKRFNSPRGRLNLIPGIKNTLIIDDTYNSSPQSSRAALDIMKDIKIPDNDRRFAVFGDMLELGSYSEEAHKKIGKYLVKSKIDKLILVGERSRDIAEGAEEAGIKKDNIFHFPDSETAGFFVQERIREGDLILVKGSEGMRMERIVKEIMADPLHAKELLVRQGDEWKDK